MILGYFNKGEKIKIKVKLKADVLYVKDGEDCFYYLDDNEFKSCMSILSKTQMVVDKEYKDDHITGTISTSVGDQTVLTTLPYDEGWHIKVDGKEVEYYKTLDSLIAFEIEDVGEYEIEFVYRSKAFVYGMICTTFFVLLFAVLVIFEKPIYKFIYAKLYDEGDEKASEGLDGTDVDVLPEASECEAEEAEENTEN